MKTLFVGQNRIYVKSLASTNSYASELMRQIGVADGTIIYSFDQKKGRGQRGNGWESEPNKNVTLSLVLYPSFLLAGEQFLLTQITALAIADLMAELLGGASHASSIQIKWPNDIYVTDKKIAGILIENYIRDQTIQSSIIGVGININQENFVTTPNATSLFKLTGITMELETCIGIFCKCFEERFLQLKENKLLKLRADYLHRLYRVNEWAMYATQAATPFKAKITDVSKTGKLLLELANGERKEFNLKEISFI